MSHPDKQIGKYVYSSHDLLGKGSYSQVFLGQNQETSTPVAIKVIENHLLKNSNILSSITQECEIMRTLHHRNVVQLHEILTTINHTYIIQEFCNQKDLRKLLESQGNFKENEAVHVISQVLEGFKELLKHNILHRDLKPANILISDHVCKIADFGFAIHVEELEREVRQKSLAGTPLYMSPQCLQGEPYSTKSDIWSLGIVLYELIFGDVPWPSNSRFELLQALRTRPLRFPSQIPTSSLLKDFLQKCLKFEESERIDWESIYRHPLFKSGNIGKDMVFLRNQRNMIVNVEYQEKIEKKPAKTQEPADFCGNLSSFVEIFLRVSALSREIREKDERNAFNQEKLLAFELLIASFASDFLEKVTDKENKADFLRKDTEKTREIQRKKQVFSSILKKMREKVSEIQKFEVFDGEDAASSREQLMSLAKKLVFQGNHAIFLDFFAKPKEKPEETLKTHAKTLHFLHLLLSLLGILGENQGDLQKTLEKQCKSSEFFLEPREISLENYKEMRDTIYKL